MATREKNYTEETAQKKQQKRVPEPDKGGTEDAVKDTPKEIPLTSGAVPPQEQSSLLPKKSIPRVPVQGSEVASLETGVVNTPVSPTVVAPDVNFNPLESRATNNVEDLSGPPKQMTTKVTEIPPGGALPPVDGNPITPKTTNTTVATSTPVVTDTPTTTPAATTNVGEKTPLFRTDPKLQAEYEAEVKGWGLNGNVDMYNRPMVSGKGLKAVGWGMKDGKDDGSIRDDDVAAVYTQTWLLGEEDPNGPYKGADGKNYAHNLVITPLLKDGTVWSPAEVDGYLDDLYETSRVLQEKGQNKSPLELDAELAGIIVGMDTPVGTEDKIRQAGQKYYTGIQGKPGENTQNGGNEAGKDGNAKNGDITTKTIENGSHNGELSKSVNGNAPSVSVADWKKNYADFSKEQLETVIAANKGTEGIDPNKVKALEELYAEKGGSLKDIEQEKKAAETEPVGLTDEEKAAKAQARQDVKVQYAGSNKSLEDKDLKVVSEAKLVEAGWVGASGKGNQIFYPQIVTIKDGKGKKHKVLMSPINSEGAVMSREAFKKYVDDLDGADDIMAEDASSCGLIIRMDTSDGDLEALDKLAADMVKGENPSTMTLAEREVAEKKTDPNVETYEKQIAEANEALKAAKEALADPTKSPKRTLIEENEKRRDEFDKETEQIKKGYKRRKLIASIGDLLQSVLNSVGAWYGAKSADLTSIRGNVGAEEERELTRREKMREEIVESLDKARNKLGADLAKDVEYWQKHLDSLTQGLMKYNTDTAKLFKQAALRDESESKKTMEQGQRRANDAKLRRQEQEQKHNDALELEAFRQAGREKLAKIPRVSQKSSTYNAYYHGSGGEGKSGKPKKKSGSRQKAKHFK